ncbi:7749_t:CDS:2 [Funneliformis caledonium]|uniref:7749_t:CDS:1 n=1 Tax=Funneliformis caledonium TaxID=1117310 RepID=A0A9N9DNW5_9GLOM|nr:7749_t:CDS:2 [Funneliformis caledonium]
MENFNIGGVNVITNIKVEDDYIDNKNNVINVENEDKYSYVNFEDDTNKEIFEMRELSSYELECSGFHDVMT